MLYTRNMTQTAYLRRRTGADAYGADTYAAVEEVCCRWQVKFDMIRDQSGREVVSAAQVYVGAEVAVGDTLALHENGPHFQIRQLGRSPSLRAGEELLKVWL